MNDWTIWQYKKIITAFLDECSDKMYEHLLQRLDALSEKGNECTYPITKPLKNTNGLYELRSNKIDNKRARLIFYFKPGKRIIFVNAFYKPHLPRYTKQALKNRQKIEKGGEETHGLSIVS